MKGLCSGTVIWLMFGSKGCVVVAEGGAALAVVSAEEPSGAVAVPGLAAERSAGTDVLMVAKSGAGFGGD
ncbi:MAG: hypothetical protein IPF53_06430 [Blastocatellia bacterium]|nr:hypothetical protein [Blastocatellia bacterium]